MQKIVVVDAELSPLVLSVLASLDIAPPFPAVDETWFTLCRSHRDSGVTAAYSLPLEIR